MRFPYLPPAQIQSRLSQLAAIFILLLGITLSLAPAVREKSWQVEYRWDHWSGILIWLILLYFAHQQIARLLPDADPYLLPITALLSGWGMLEIWRLTAEFGLRQSLWLAVCFGFFFLGLRNPQLLAFLKRYKYIWLTSGLALTALTFILGANPGGSGPRLWLGCCGVYFQPSEPLKLLLVIYLAAYFAGRMPISGKIFSLILPTLLITGLALAILVIQRDLGTASIFVFLYAVMVYQASAKRRILLLSGALLISFGLAGYFFIDIIRYRLLAWLDPWQDPSGRSYQVIQSLLAIANGGVFGRGLGLGSPGVVPVAHSDFIFIAIAEEMGLVGSIGLFALIALLVTRSYLIALRAESHFQRLLAAGLGAYLGAQGLVILGGNLRLLPLTGVTLPFVSYGGSSLLTSFVAMLLLLQISNAAEQDPAPLNKAQPYLLMPALFSLGLLATALANGWWAVVRSADLLARSDNPRRSIADRYVPRGKLVDRNNLTLSDSQGSPGSYQRIYHYSDLSTTLGYTHPVYGQAGLEAELDPYLRGLDGYPASTIWLEHLLYGTPPAGLDVRLSLDLKLQEHADMLFGANSGALVLLNASNGEILAIASHPTFDANQLDETGASLLTAPGSPLVNRATQGQYATGTSLAPFLLAEMLQNTITLPDFPTSLLLQADGQLLRCTLREPAPPTWENALAAGCPTPLLTLANRLGEEKTISLMQKLGLKTQSDSLQNLALGQSVATSPLNLALAAATISNGGTLPVAISTLAVNLPEQGWVVLASQEEAATNVFMPENANQAAEMLAVRGKPYWESMGVYQNGVTSLVWYLGGTLPGWQGTPLALAIVFEIDEAQLAQSAGRSMMEFSIQP